MESLNVFLKYIWPREYFRKILGLDVLFARINVSINKKP